MKEQWSLPLKIFVYVGLCLSFMGFKFEASQLGKSCFMITSFMQDKPLFKIPIINELV